MVGWWLGWVIDGWCWFCDRVLGFGVVVVFFVLMFEGMLS